MAQTDRLPSARSARPAHPDVPRIEGLVVRNYRALRDLSLTRLTPLSVLLGPNGSGKSTVFDVFAFLSECFSVGLRKAWDKRGRFKELRSRGAEGNIVIEIKYRERRGLPVLTYHLEIGERGPNPYVAREWLAWRRVSYGNPFHFLDFEEGRGRVISGEMPDEHEVRIDESLNAPDVLAVNALGQLAKHPRVVALRRFITDWYLCYLSADDTRGTPEAGPQERLSQSGDNLSNVIQSLREQHPQRLDFILSRLAERVPRISRVDAEELADGRLMLRIKDAPFDRPILAKFVSDGTLKMLSYLTLLHDPTPPQLISIEEPENYLHPRLLEPLAEECRESSARAQLMITTHSPFFVNGLRPNELWVLDRDETGFTRAKRAAEMDDVTALVNSGGRLGQLWMEGFFEFGYPPGRR